MPRQNARVTRRRNSRSRTTAIELEIASGASNSEIMARHDLTYTGLRRIKDEMMKPDREHTVAQKAARA